MQKETLSEDDEKQQEEELIPVEVDPNAVKQEASDQGADEKPDAEDDDDDEDERLAESQDDQDEQVTQSRNRDKRIKRRELRKQAKERTLRELQALKIQNEQLMQRLSSLEGNALNNNALMVDQRLSEASREVEQADLIIAKAIEAQNGQDVATAMKLRDDAKARAAQLAQVKARLEQAKQRPQQSQSDPRVAMYAKEWIEANSWYDPQGRDEDSAITNAIDSRLKAEGYDPSTEDYWVELTNRVSRRLGTDQESPAPRASRKDAENTEKRKAPPIGNSKEHAPVSTRREVYVSPERKQAMIDAGIWDNTEARNRMLKAYRDYDKNSAR